MKKITIILILIAAILAGCDLKQDVAPMPTFVGEANTTIAELLAMHPIGSEDSYDSIPIGSNIIICGYVTTSDEWGNNYKYINIEDETGAIQIKINHTALYKKYQIGERIYVKCDGLVLGDYRKLPQLGLWANGAMQPIPSFKTYLYLFPDGAPTGGFNPIDMTTVPAANDIPSTMYNRKVRLLGATFVEGGMATFSDPGAATSHDIKMSDGSTITLRTSNYATFAGKILPVGTGEITGILTRYNNYVQLVINSPDDLVGFTVPVERQTIFSVDYNNAFNDGWFQTGTGNDWQTMVNNNFSGFVVNPASDQDKYLISPAVDLSDVSNPELSFTHRAPQGFSPNTMMCFYTPNYTGDMSSSLWIPFDLSAATGQTTSNNFSIELPEGAQTANFRLMFHITTAPSSWYISDIKITGVVQ
ncbi:MAG: OB-fold nucleic acid binding domain-containing protein [Bacteroidales bacterium]|nr:OB-fold nucleic acid binding domain-containing protein [Bacteroidales bacterium]